MDYVTHLKSDGTYQPLREHEENVAALAGEFAAAFGAQEHGHRTGLLHDIGKAVDHEVEGTHRQIQRQRAEAAARSGAYGQGGSRFGGRAAGGAAGRLLCCVCRGGSS